MGASWEGNIWLECEGWKGSLWEDSHPLKALIVSSVEQFFPKPERRGGKKEEEEEEEKNWMNGRTLYS